MEIMNDFIKKHFQGRFYRKRRNRDEFIEDISYYFLNGQTKKYIQAWETRLYKTLKLLDPDSYRNERRTKDMIREVEEAGAELKVYKERTERK
jgi:hypothetical protein